MNFKTELERLGNLIEFIKRNENFSDFNSGIFDLKNTLEDQHFLVLSLAKQADLTKEDENLIRRFTMEIPFLLM